MKNAALLFLLLAAPARASDLVPVPVPTLNLSSATVSDPHALVRGLLPPSTSYRNLTVFPERLTYEMSWGLLNVGQATMEAEDIVDFNGRPAYHIKSRATSNSFCDAFYKVRDLNESWIDAVNMVSLGYSKKLREGQFFRDEWVLFDQDQGRYLAKKTDKDGKYSYSAGTVPVTVQDILSSLYYVRYHDLRPGSEIVLDVNTKENWPLVIRVIRRETVRVPAGKFAAVLVEPAIRQEGIFIQKGKKLQIWLTDDAKKIPVQLKVEVFFGHVKASLAKML